MKRKIVIAITIIFSSSAVTFARERKSVGQDYLFSLHYPKFYGDSNTRHGSFSKRSYLVGPLDDPRTFLADHGISVGASLYQFLGANLAGGAEDGTMRYSGAAEYWFMLDTAKAGLWSKGVFFIRAQSSWYPERSNNNDTGSLLASNAQCKVKTPGKAATTLSEITFAQYLSDKFILRVGRASLIIDGTLLANDGRYQFLYGGLINNPIIVRLCEDLKIGVMPSFIPNDKHSFSSFIGIETNSDTPTKTSNTCCGIQYTRSLAIKENLTGNYRILTALTRKPITKLTLDGQRLVGQDIEAIVTEPYQENYGLLLNFDQYIWHNPNHDIAPYRKDFPSLGIMLFGRAGWAPDDRNVIDQFYSIGIGGYGGPGSRYYDIWGLGYAATHISQKVRKVLCDRQILFNECEHALELFYNAQIVPSLHFSLHAQLISPPLISRDIACVVMGRLEVDF